METTIEEAATMSAATVDQAHKKLVQATIDLHPPQVFGEQEKWQLAPNLAVRAKKLAEQHALAANGYRVAYFWRKTGGQTRGQLKYGDVKLLTGMEKELAGYDIAVWMAADHCKPLEEKQIEAQLFHLLCHIGSNDETGEPMLREHDWAAFALEVETYGAHTLPLTHAKAVLEQAKLL